MSGSSGEDAQHGDATLTAVIVYFRTPRRLQESLGGLQGQSAAPARIVVIDNSSALEQSHDRPIAGSGYTWVRAEVNLGYAAACNLGARMTAGEYLLFLNADLVLDARACERLLQTARADHAVAVVGPRIIATDGSVELSAREFPTARTSVLGRSSLATKVLARLDRAPRAVTHARRASRAVDWVSGACMLIRREAFEAVGGFDEGYWMYWEDADICRRLRDAGWRTALCVDATARHRTGSSGRSEQTIRAFHDSASRYYERHVARTRLAAAIARTLLRVRMKLVLAVHGRRVA